MYRYSCINADWKVFGRAAVTCFSCHNRDSLVQDLSSMWKNSQNSNHVIPCLSVRTGLDLFLTVKKFPAGSEIIMSAVNIPDMITVVRHHGLKVVPLDISIDTSGPKPELLDGLITEKTVAVLVAHIYGKWISMDPIIKFAQKHGLSVIEDCAEVFCGFEKLGHPESDIILFSFGVIKYYTAFGGAIAKIKDSDLFSQMKSLYDTYRVQKQSDYLYKIVKYFVPFIFLNCPSVIKPCMFLTRTFNIDHKAAVIKLLRGFPDHLMERIRHRPSTALLKVMLGRFKSFSQSDFNTIQVKGEYVKERLPDSVTLVGQEAEVNNYWLFPFLADNPDNMVKLLNAMGVDAYRGATQLNLIEPETSGQNGESVPFDPLYPYEAKYLIDHVVYLPVNKTVPFEVLDKICKCVELAVKMSKVSPVVRVRSKL
ncbi:hypothetical protein ACJMK2_014075 [Sinanodonta woodiana]|uniref:Uncharacterized protein n=1 Tax=Sinanodonta woodiana TaxID=1069815 RepID=A0ABD3V0B1_SINWO